MRHSGSTSLYWRQLVYDCFERDGAVASEWNTMRVRGVDVDDDKGIRYGMVLPRGPGVIMRCDDDQQAAELTDSSRKRMSATLRDCPPSCSTQTFHAAFREESGTLTITVLVSSTSEYPFK